MKKKRRNFRQVLSFCLGCLILRSPALANGKALEALFDKMRTPVPSAKQEAQESIGSVLEQLVKKTPDALKNEGLPAIRKALSDPQGDVRHFATFLLYLFMPMRAAAKVGTGDQLSERPKEEREIFSLLAEVLRDPDPRVQEMAVMTFATMPQQPPQAITAVLLTLVDDPYGQIQEATLIALGRIRPVTPQVTETLLQVLRRDQQYQWYLSTQQPGKLSYPDSATTKEALIRTAAIQALGNLGTHDAIIIDTLQGALTASPQSVMQEALNALEKFGPSARVALPEIAKIARDPEQDPLLRRKAMEVLSRLGATEPLTTATLIDIAKTKDGEVQVTALRYLRALGASAHAALSEVKKIAENPDEDQRIRAEARETLERIQGE